MKNTKKAEATTRENCKITDKQTALEAAKEMSTQLKAEEHIFYGIKYQDCPAIYFTPILITDREFSIIKWLFNNASDSMVFAIHAPCERTEVKR